MSVKIKGLVSGSHGYWRFLPSSKGLPRGTPRPKAIALGTKVRDEAIKKVLEMGGIDNDRRGIKEWGEIYRQEKLRLGRHRKITSSGVKATLEELNDHFGNIDPTRITKAKATDWYHSLQKPSRTHATTHRYLRYARGFFSWMLNRKLVTENPFSKMGMKSVTQSKRDRFCTAEERDALIAACIREDLRTVLMLGFYLGMRINEIVNARWSWFTLTKSVGTCTVRNEEEGFTTKTGRERMIPLHGKLATHLAALPRRKGKPDDYVIHPEKPREKAHLRWDPLRAFRKLVKDCDMTWVTPHTMRHTFGSLHAIAGTPEIKIRRWMGITPQTWDRHYAGLCPDDRAIDNI
jgi:integrase